jgi:hypothetical protein
MSWSLSLSGHINDATAEQCAQVGAIIDDAIDALAAQGITGMSGSFSRPDGTSRGISHAVEIPPAPAEDTPPASETPAPEATEEGPTMAAVEPEATSTPE